MIYVAYAVLVLTGVGWLIADRGKDTANAELWQEAAASLLMLHGGGAMLTLLLLGALVPLHVQRAWRGRKNRTTGATMVTLNVLLVVTAFGLYYAGSDVVRLWISDVHIAIGMILPALFIIHVLLGRRSARRLRSD
jgi:heme A synthase